VSDVDKWISLYNTRDLNGWIAENGSTGAWSGEKGAIVGHGESPGHWLLTNRDYADFVLRLELNVDKDARGGIGLRAVPGEFLGGKAAKAKGLKVNHPRFDFIAGGERPIDHHLAPGGDVRRVNPSKPLAPAVWHRVE